MSIKTDYKDDIFSGSRKYQQVDNSDGTVSFTDVTEYTQEGDTISASDMNAITAAVIQTYTHSYDSDTGTHTLSNTSGGANGKFIATAAFTTGDTFALNGETVTAITPDGGDLSSGSFAEDAAVLFAVTESGITIFVANDSDRFENYTLAVTKDGAGYRFRSNGITATLTLYTSSSFTFTTGTIMTIPSKYAPEYAQYALAFDNSYSGRARIDIATTGGIIIGYVFSSSAGQTAWTTSWPCKGE